MDSENSEGYAKSRNTHKYFPENILLCWFNPPNIRGFEYILKYSFRNNPVSFVLYYEKAKDKRSNCILKFQFRMIKCRQIGLLSAFFFYVSYIFQKFRSFLLTYVPTNQDVGVYMKRL